MRAVRMVTLLSSLASLDGGQVLSAVSATNQANYAEYLGMALDYAWAWAEWPEIQRVRQRAPSSGLVTWEESGQPNIGHVYAVTLDHPDTKRNPRPAVWRMDAQGRGIRVFETSGDVYVRHARQCPRLSATAWSSSTAYQAGDAAYENTTGKVFESITDANTNNALNVTAHWREIEIPAVLHRALVRGAYALKTGKDGQKQTETLLQRSMDELLAAAIQTFRGRAGQHQTMTFVNPVT